MIVRIEDPSIFVGLDLAEAERRIRDHGYESLVTHRDTHLRMTPQGGYDPLRVKLQIIKGKVDKATIG